MLFRTLTGVVWLCRGPCAQYQDNACCNASIIHAPAGASDNSFLLGLYGDAYSHKKCGNPSAQCTALLVEEACGYECDVNWGRFRHESVQCGEQHGHGKWQVSGLPIEVRKACPFIHVLYYFHHWAMLTTKVAGGGFGLRPISHRNPLNLKPIIRAKESMPRPCSSGSLIQRDVACIVWCTSPC